MLEFAPYTPDQPDLAGGTIIAKNVLPRTGRSYGPLSSLTSVADALTNRAQGAAAFRNSVGNVFTFAGDVSDLFLLSGTTFDNVSSSAGAYTTAADDAVEFVKFGERVMSANGHVDPIQSYVMGTSAKFATLAAAAPRAKHMGIIKDFVMVGNTWDSVDGSVGNRVWWPAINDPTDWPVIGSTDAAQKQSDRQDLPIGGNVQAITGSIGGAHGAIFCEKAIYRVTYEGSPLVFSFFAVEEDRGTPAPNSVVNVGNLGFYLSEDGFYRFDGSGSIPIGAQRVDKTFFADLDQNYFDRIYGAADPINKMVFWSYPAAGNTGGRPNKLIIYNWDVDRWAFAEVENDILFRDLSAGYTLEELDQFGTIDTLPFSLDSRAWTGGAVLLSAFDSDKKLAQFSGDSMAAAIETPELGGMELLRSPHSRIYVDGVRPYVDGGTITISLKHRATPGGALATDGPNVIDSDGQAHFTRSTRYARAEINIAAAGAWTHAQGVDFTVSDDGEF